MSSNNAISVNSLSKRYGKSAQFAVKEVSFNVKKGEVYGFLGSNGAGKSTTIRILMNSIKPTSGSATILGNDVTKDYVNVHRNVGYLPGDFDAYPKLTGRQLIEYYSELSPASSNKIKDLARTFNLDLTKKIGSLSKGNRQKLGLVQAFMHDPDVLILDEPTSGLDPVMQENFYSLIKKHKTAGKSVLLSSHNLTEVEKVCDRFGIIKAGVLVKEGSLNEIKAEHAKVYEITFADEVPLLKIKQLEHVTVIRASKKSITVKVQSGLSRLLRVVSAKDVLSIDQQQVEIEDSFMKFYEKTGTK
jgi:ABC-2 type transport system ATP-binding protein